ncbi:MAG TPA: malto-oligosyltrehalose synthase [Nevskiaceae bacterium]|nr:malto-oligosyltrehalose synthase [Nevskiaceae bacterium]
MTPRATLRLQLHRGFTFADAAARVDYFAALGVSHLYLSPILTARAGSMHGYDVIDHAHVNPELGGEDGFRALAAKARERGLGIIVDIVPNHMAVGGADNAWWLDVLEHGRDSRYATFFDIDWHVTDPALRGRIAAPFLGKPYGEALASGEIKLECDGGKWHAQYFEHRFPLAPRTVNASLAEIGSDPARLHQLFERQHWRLAWWRTAADEINWRRFFDIISLAALRVEEPAVFDAVHATTLRLCDEGLIDGVRIDHIDGLADPRAYCRKLRSRLKNAYIIVEKILAPGERLHRDWQIDGTSGYSFMNHVNALLHDPSGEAPLTALWTGITGRAGDFEVEERRARRRIVEELLVADFNATAQALHRIARSDPSTRDVTLGTIRRVLTEILVQMPVYRVYADRRGRSTEDEALMAGVRERARKACRPHERELVDVIDRWVGGEAPMKVRPPRAQRLRMRAIARFQQLCAPLAAKAVEDTAFYRHGRLLSRNEVGADPAQFAMSVDQFHRESLQRLEHFPDTLLATATHDHKRGEGVRSRLAVLSEMPQRWEDAVGDWLTRNASLRAQIDGLAAPGAADEYMLYQMLFGAWPLALRPDDRAGLDAFRERIAQWQLKALREAKLRTSWVEPNLAYEEACAKFLERLLDPRTSADFLAGLFALVDTLAPAAALNGLSQALLRMTTPGVPDLYQGTEFWDLSLVDPDNRRRVDFDARIAALQGDAQIESMLAGWRDGRIKQQLIARTLKLRAQLPQLFARGGYEPITATGTHADRIVAFLRRDRDARVLVVVPRCCAPLVEQDRPRVTPERWADTRLPMKGNVAWRDALDDRAPIEGDALAVSQLLGRWPVGLFVAR